MDDLTRPAPADATQPAPSVASWPNLASPPASSFSPRVSSLPTLLWVLLAILFVFYLAPSLVGRVAYELEHNRQLAQWDVAKQTLASHNLNDVAHDFGAIAKAIGPSVVHIDTVKLVRNRFHDEWSGLLGQQRNYLAEGQGSGVIVDPNGYVVTNWHVVENARSIRVGLSDGRQVDADLVGADPLTDLAVLKVVASELVAAEWGDSDRLDVGSLVWAVGNPYGLDRSITFGIISAKNRQFAESSRDPRTPYQDFLQSDAAVNPGNSGGPLVNVEGKIVGINTAIYGQSYQGISFAIPSNLAHEVYDRLRSEGRVVRGWLGAKLAEMTPDTAREFGLPPVFGALIEGIVPESPAKKAGLRVGDVILEWDGRAIDSPTTLIQLVGRAKVGAKVMVKLLRDGQEMMADVVVEERPSNLQ